jgi:hypothetical protein
LGHKVYIEYNYIVDIYVRKIVTQSTNQGFKVEFETKNCWLKFFIQTRWLFKLSKCWSINRMA